MMLPSLPLLRYPRAQQPHLVDRSNITRLSLRQSQKQGGHNNVTTTATTTIHWMAFVIIVIIATTFTTTSSVAGFQRQTQYPLLPNGLRTNPLLYKSAPFSRTNAVETTTRTPTILIQPWHTQQIHLSSTRRYKTQLYFMGSDSGILGVGGPEVFLIVLVGYFVLGPSDLYKLVKQIGAFIQNIRTLGNDLSTTFESNMESTLQLEEIRKAQRELNDAFSFRRTINVDADSDAFSVQAGSAQKAEAERMAAATAATATSASATMSTGSNVTSAQPQQQPKKIRRRIRKKEEPVVPDLPSMSEYNMQSSDFITNNIPDLEMPTSDVGTSSERSISDEEAAIIEKEFDQYVVNPMASTFDDWNSWDGTNRKDDEARTETSTTPAATVDPATKLVEQNRFQQQMSGNWNDQILKAGDALEPIALVMNKIALLEQEKNAALQRLDEEYAQRTAIEEKYYKEQRQLLEETARDVQSNAFGFDSKKTIA